MSLSLNTSALRIQPPPVSGNLRYLLRPLPEPGHFLFVVDNSAAERFICPTLARNYLVYGREPHPTNAALIFGGALHVGIEVLLRGPKAMAPIVNGEQEIKLEDSTELLVRAATALTLYFTKHPSPMDEYRTLPHALEVLKFYQQRLGFPDYYMEIAKDERGPLIERAFELPLGTIKIEERVQGIFPYIESNEYSDKLDITHAGIWIDTIHVAWAGRIDVVGQCNGKMRIVDHKTTSQGSSDFINDFHLSSQTRGYLWAARQLWPELNVDGFCLDAIHFKKPSSGCGIMDRGPRGGEPALKFFRSYFDYSDASIAQWESNTMTRVEDFLHSLVRGNYPQEATYCFNRKYGKCPYHDCCVIEIEDLEAAKKLLFSEAYRPVTWNPTDDR